MNLTKIFEKLQIPTTDSQQLFNATTLSQYPFAKIGVNHLGHPVVLISSTIGRNVVRRNIRLRYLELTYNNECKISENNEVNFSNFIIIQFKSEDITLKTYFLNIVKTLIESLSKTPTQEEIVGSLRNFIEIFRALSEQPTNTIQGLWSELFLIESCKTPAILLYYWHNLPMEKFDFNAGNDKIEVKSSSLLNRIHNFSSEQLFAFNDTQILVASLFVKQSTVGIDILELIENIERSVEEIPLREKLLVLISKTLGSAIEQSIKVKFDYDLAKQSLKFYKHQDIEKIEHMNIPNRVSDVHYKSDLSLIDSVAPSAVNSKSNLFNAL